MLARRGNALKGASVGAAYSQAVRDSVTLREDVLERHCSVGEGRPKSVRSRSLTLGREWRRGGIEVSRVTRREELLDDSGAPPVSHPFEEATYQRFVLFC